MWPIEDREATQRLIRESILEVCRVNFNTTSGTPASSFEVDGIICITAHSGSGDGDRHEQLVVKLHERVAGENQYRNNQNMTGDFRRESVYAQNRRSEFSRESPAVADSSLLRGYLSTVGNRPAVHGNVAVSLPHRQHQQLVRNRYQQSLPGDKRKIIDENENSLYTSVKKVGGQSGSMGVPDLAVKRELHVSDVDDQDNGTVLDLHVAGVLNKNTLMHSNVNECSSPFDRRCSPQVLNKISSMSDHIIKLHSDKLELNSSVNAVGDASAPSSGVAISLPEATTDSEVSQKSIKLQNDPAEVTLTADVEGSCDTCQADSVACVQHDGNTVRGAESVAGVSALSRRKQTRPKKEVAVDEIAMMVYPDDISLEQSGDSTFNDVIINNCAVAVSVSAPKPSEESSPYVNRLQPVVNGSSVNGERDVSGIVHISEDEGGTDLIRSLLQRKSSPASCNGVSTVPDRWNYVAQGSGNGIACTERAYLDSACSSVNARPANNARNAAAHSPDSSASSSPYTSHASEQRIALLADRGAANDWCCPHCAITLRNFESFAAHCRVTHKRHACPYCLQTFTQRVNRDRHLYNHTGEKPYDCADCGFGFTRRDALRKHQLRTNHGGGMAMSSTDSLCLSPPNNDYRLNSTLYTSRPQSSMLMTDMMFLSPNARPLGMRDDRGGSSSYNPDREEDEDEDDADDRGLDLSTGCGLDLSINSSTDRTSSAAKDDTFFESKIPATVLNANIDDRAATGSRSVSRSNRSGGRDRVGGMRHGVARSNVIGANRSNRRGTTSVKIEFDVGMDGGNGNASGDRAAESVATANTSGIITDDGSFSLAATDLMHRTFRCDVCGSSFVGARVYTEHCRAAHGRTPCTYCAKTFSQKGNMERHRRQHTGERPFRCTECSAAYTRKETLRAHMSQSHTGAAVLGGGVGAGGDAVQLVEVMQGEAAVNNSDIESTAGGDGGGGEEGMEEGGSSDVEPSVDPVDPIS